MVCRSRRGVGAGAGGVWVREHGCFGNCHTCSARFPIVSHSGAPGSACRLPRHQPCLWPPVSVAPDPPAAGLLFWELRGAPGGRRVAPHSSVLLCDPGPGPVALRCQGAEGTAESHPASQLPVHNPVSDVTRLPGVIDPSHPSGSANSPHLSASVSFCHRPCPSRAGGLLRPPP